MPFLKKASHDALFSLGAVTLGLKTASVQLLFYAVLFNLVGYLHVKKRNIINLVNFNKPF